MKSYSNLNKIFNRRDFKNKSIFIFQDKALKEIFLKLFKKNIKKHVKFFLTIFSKIDNKKK